MDHRKYRPNCKEVLSWGPAPGVTPGDPQTSTSRSLMGKISRLTGKPRSNTTSETDSNNVGGNQNVEETNKWEEYQSEQGYPYWFD